jgi:jasmonate O-methyltransferase
VKTIVEENMILMVSKKTNNYCWKVADLGCSSGPNTLMVLSNIMNIINKITLKLNHVITPTFQIYLNDLFENDFNTIFKLLPDFYQQIKEENVGECFINATPRNDGILSHIFNDGVNPIFFFFTGVKQNTLFCRG